MDIALKFDSIDVARTMSRVLRRQMMVVKEREKKRGGEDHRCGWMCILTNSSVLLSCIYLHQIFLSFSFFFAHARTFILFFCSASSTSNNITNISVRTTQMRAHIYTPIVLCIVRVRFFYVNKKLFFLLL